MSFLTRFRYRKPQWPTLFLMGSLTIIFLYSLSCLITSDALRKVTVEVEKVTGQNSIRYNLTYSAHPASRCQKPLGILVMIKTCFQYRHKRDLLRKTWANEKYLSELDVPVEYTFILGHGIYPDEASKKIFMDEVETEKDFIMADFVDTYRNNTYKSMSGLRWSSLYCKEFEYLFMIDDDMYISLRNVITFLRNVKTYPKRSPGKSLKKYGFSANGSKFFWGGFIYSAPVYPKRDPEDKLYISWDEYPNATFPSFVPGGAILYSRTCVRKFLESSQLVKHLSLDDVYLSLIADKIHVQPFRMNDFILNKWNWKRNTNQEIKTIGIHGVEPEELIEFWKKYEKGI